MNAKEQRKQLSTFIKYLNELEALPLLGLQIEATNRRIHFCANTTKQELQIALIKYKAYELFDPETKRLEGYKSRIQQTPVETSGTESSVRSVSGDLQGPASSHESSSS